LRFLSAVGSVTELPQLDTVGLVSPQLVALIIPPLAVFEANVTAMRISLGTVCPFDPRSKGALQRQGNL
jgi:hypothetical protein